MTRLNLLAVSGGTANSSTEWDFSLCSDALL